MKKINTFTLKLIAVISMVIDHVGAVFFPKIDVLRILGRVAFPIFAYVLVEGFLHTSDVKKYMLRLGIFAVLSEIPYDLLFSRKTIDFEYQNIYFTLLLGICMMWLMSQTKSIIIQFAIVAILNYLCGLLHFDFGAFGLLLIFVFYIFKERKTERLFLAAVILVALTEGIQLYAILSLFLIAFHSGEQGPKWKPFFYIFYPAHLLVLYLISLLV